MPELIVRKWDGPYSFMVFREYGVYKARRGDTGQVQFEDPNKSVVIQQAINSLLQGGTIFLREIQLPSGLTIPTNVLIVEDYQGVRSFYTSRDVYPPAVEPYSYIIFKDGDLFKAKTGKTGEISLIDEDAATVIQAAIDAMSRGQSLFIKAIGEETPYPISETITITAPKHGIEIIGERETILQSQGDFPVITIGDGVTAVGQTAIRNIRIQGKWQDNPSWTNSIGIRLNKAYGCTIEDVHIQDLYVGVKLETQSWATIYNLFRFGGERDVNIGVLAEETASIAVPHILQMNSCHLTDFKTSAIDLTSVMPFVAVNCLFSTAEDVVGVIRGPSSDIKLVGTDFDSGKNGALLLVTDTGKNIIALDIQGGWFTTDGTVPGSYGIKHQSLNNSILTKFNIKPAYIAAHNPLLLEYAYFGEIAVGYMNGINKTGNGFGITGNYVTITHGMAEKLNNVFMLGGGGPFAVDRNRVIYTDCNSLGTLVKLTENSGTATIPNGQTSVTFPHNLAGTPTLVVLGPTHTEVADAVWSANAINITITVPSPVSADRQIGWYAEYKP